VGWIIGPPSIIGPVLRASTRIVFSTNCPLQEAVACGLEQVKDRKFFETQIAEYTERRELLTSTFDRLGLRYTLPDGSYFVLLVSFCVLACLRMKIVIDAGSVSGPLKLQVS
jgi:kynurenine aminotransferase